MINSDSAQPGRYTNWISNKAINREFLIYIFWSVTNTSALAHKTIISIRPVIIHCVKQFVAWNRTHKVCGLSVVVCVYALKTHPFCAIHTNIDHFSTKQSNQRRQKQVRDFHILRMFAWRLVEERYALLRKILRYCRNRFTSHAESFCLLGYYCKRELIVIVNNIAWGRTNCRGERLSRVPYWMRTTAVVSPPFSNSGPRTFAETGRRWESDENCRVAGTASV